MKFAGGKIARLNHRPVIAPAHDVRNGVEAEATFLFILAVTTGAIFLEHGGHAGGKCGRFRLQPWVKG